MGQRLGPFLPLPTALPNTAAGGGPASRDTGEEGSPPPAAESQEAEARKEGLAGPQPTCPRGLWKEDRSGMVGTGSTGSDPRWCRACWAPQELGDCAGGQRLWLDRRQQLLKKLLHSCHLLGVRRDCERLPAGAGREG